MSRSSGQVTHVLLTRSRLCPGPKPGSSLHLHVLGTPPAFVLSQDQTLREELPGGQMPTAHKESSGITTRGWPATSWRRATSKNLGLSLVGRGPCATSRRPDVHGGPPDARRGQSWHRRPSDPERVDRATASNLDTLLDRGIGRSVRMLLSFQRPSHLFKRGFLLRGTSETRKTDLGADR